MAGYFDGSPRFHRPHPNNTTASIRSPAVKRHAAIRSVLISVCLVLLTGCESPAGFTLDPGNPEECPFSQTQGKVTVAAWPWTDRGAVKEQFTVNLLAKDILPVQVVIANRGTETVRFSSTQVQLAYRDDCVERVLSEGEMTRRTNKNSGTAPFLIYVGTLGLGAPISMVMGPDLESDNRRIRQVRRDTRLSTITLDAWETMCGFLFFDVPEDVRLSRKEPLDTTLTIRRLPMSSGANLAFRIPMTIEPQ